eukprot:TRINITY_DN3954_c0_g2_i1.p1 TRINITY_DN3954_c0_g2~~TRINITY_DN3954_c0_g2_i1.p1  ORF type:complete len:691 (+),score=156.62 TRINITY_DN3954_c0_g2_i1:2212-4284(+)
MKWDFSQDQSEGIFCEQHRSTPEAIRYLNTIPEATLIVQHAMLEEEANRSNLAALPLSNEYVLCALTLANRFRARHEYEGSVKYAKKAYYYLRRCRPWLCTRGMHREDLEKNFSMEYHFATIVAEGSTALGKLEDSRDLCVIGIAHYIKEAHANREWSSLPSRLGALIGVLQAMNLFRKEDVILFESWVKKLIRKDVISPQTIAIMNHKVEQMKLFDLHEDAVRFLFDLCFCLCLPQYPDDSEFVALVLMDICRLPSQKDSTIEKKENPYDAGQSGRLSSLSPYSQVGNFSAFQAAVVAEMKNKNLNMQDSMRFVVNLCALVLLNHQVYEASYLTSLIEPSALNEVEYEIELEYNPKRRPFTYGYKFSDGNSQAVLNLKGTIAQLSEKVCSPILFVPTNSQLQAFSLKSSADVPKIDPRIISYEKSLALGSGGQGSVFLAELSGEQVALNKFVKSKDANFKGFRRELKSMQMLHHPGIIKAVGYYEGEQECGILFEHCEMTLATFCKEVEELGTWDIIGLLYQIALAVSYLHSFSVLHRDLKPDNILIQDWSVCKVIDFGMSKEEIDAAAASSVLGTAMARPPEYFDDPDFKGHKAGDVYSFAMVIYFMLHKRHAFEGDYNVSKKVSAGKRPEIDREVETSEPYLVDLMKRCWSQEWAGRPTFSQIAHELYCKMFVDRCVITKSKKSFAS